MSRKTICYINLDGFPRYYYDSFIERYPNCNFVQASKDGVFFDNLRNALPSITNPCQNMILTGSSSIVTGNVYRYFDRKNNVVVQQGRENKNKTIVDVALEKGLRVISIAHYLTQAKLTSQTYIYPDNTSKAVLDRIDKQGDHFSRFEQLIKVIKKEKIISQGEEIIISDLPDLIVFYADDLDGVGHNMVSCYGYPIATNESQRMENVLSLLKEMDDKFGEFIVACKQMDVYKDITFYITTDHGMTSFGLEDNTILKNYGKSCLPQLREVLHEIDKSYVLEMVNKNESPSKETTVVGVGCNLNLYLSFLEKINDKKLEQIKQRLLREEYVESVQTRTELKNDLYAVLDVDLVVTPTGRYFFSKSEGQYYTIRGQHDSSIASANHIFGMIFGNEIMKDVIWKDKTYNYDFGTTMAYQLGIEIPNANGKIIQIFAKGNK